MFGWLKKKKKQKPEQVETIESKEKKVVEEQVEEKQVVVEKTRKESYHITKHPDGGWQIKKGKAQRATKKFKTQKEAIDYAKELEKNGASYIIHKADGTTRKKKY